jgi:hypothetical protein
MDTSIFGVALIVGLPIVVAAIGYGWGRASV